MKERIRNQDLREGMLVYHAVEGAIGRVRKIYKPGERLDENERPISHAVAIVTMNGQDEEFVLPENGKQFRRFPEAALTLLKKVDQTYDDSIKSLCSAGSAMGLDDEVSMLVIGCVIRERLRKIES
jgi:hypothetical protein